MRILFTPLIIIFGLMSILSCIYGQMAGTQRMPPQESFKTD